jgi:hypothetical protein
MFRYLSVVLLLAQSAFALGPHEILLLENRNSPRSRELARDYASLRQVPDSNLVSLDLQATPSLEMSPDDFTRLILKPAQEAAVKQGVSDHILAWVYSLDFPIRITSTPPVSLQGITFVKGKLPPQDDIGRGTFVSPLFAGPDNPSHPGFPAQSLDVQLSWQGKDFPIPSMMLGFMGPNGNTREEILACLRTGSRSDRTRPDGTVGIVTNSDVRSLCRQWEVAPAARELSAHAITTLITNDYPRQNLALTGIMTGAADIPALSAGRFTFHPGAIADNLTSFGAAFENKGQTKISEWIRAGATASAGTVTEPLSIWTKFPIARVFAHPVAGCTILESYFQAIRCPLQILIIGDPLACPWGPASSISLDGLPAGPLAERRVVSASVNSRESEFFNRFLFLLDGRTLQAAGRSPELTLDPAAIPAGKHKLRVVAYGVGSVRSQIFFETELEVK